MNFYFERSNIFGLVGCLFLRHKEYFCLGGRKPGK